MSDERVRELERRAEQGEPGARAALVAERMRIGEISRERVQLAAYVDDPDAREVAPPRFGPPSDLDVWARGFARWGREAVLRAGVAAEASCAREIRDYWFLVASRWLVCPCREHEDQLRGSLDLDRLEDTAERMICATVVSTALRPRVPGLPARRLWNPVGEACVRAAILQEVAAWALGRGDAVRLRHEAGDG